MTKTALFLAALLAAASAAAQTVKLQTSEGDIVLELNAEKAPRTVANFVQYVKAGHYNGVIFHRVIGNFMVQTGGYDAKLNHRPTKPPIPLESHNRLSNTRGTVAMARTGDPNSATSQFFINVVDNFFLDGDPGDPRTGYAVFGQVVDGMDVVDKIRAAETKPAGMHENLPVKPIFINKASIVEAAKK